MPVRPHVEAVPQAEVPPPVQTRALPSEPFWKRYRVGLALLVVMIFAAFFRFYGQDFDQGTHQHPDERFITQQTAALIWPSDLSQLLQVKTSPMNLRRVDA